MLKGVVMAMGIQKKAAKGNFIFQWIAYPICIYILAFYLGKGIVGIWISKVALECCLVVWYYLEIIT